MRILILTRTYPPDSGAVGHLVHELAEALVRKGNSLTVIAAGSGPTKASAGVEVKRVGWLPFSRKNHLVRALSYLSLYPAMLLGAALQRRPDVIVTTTDPPLQVVLGVFLKWRFRCRLVHWSQDLYPEMAEEAGVLRKRGAFANALRWISTTALRSHDWVVSIGRCMTDRLLARGLAREKIVEIANWTDPEWLRPIDQSENDFWKREGLQDRFVLVYSGNMGLAHSFDEMLGAAKILKNEAPDVLFLFIGEGPRRSAVEQEATSGKLENVRFLPAQPWSSLSQSLSAGQLHLVSLRENLSGLVVPSKFYGGMASGRPCLFIGPPDSEVARVIREAEVGRVLEPSNPDALARVLLEYRGDPERIRAEGRKARDLGEKSTLANAADRFAEVLR